MSLYQELVARGLVEQTSDPELAKLLDDGAANPISVYCGFDPTASSLHIGSLLPLLMLRRLQRAGHRPIALVGGATGMIGDPSGKSLERVLLTPEIVAENLRGIRDQAARFLDFSGGTAARIVNNADWFNGIHFIDFLRDIGKHFSVNAMIAKDSVRMRLSERDQGISYTEFSYMLIQAYDFLWLFEHEGCCLQVGGSDQWGNITAGIDLVRRKKHSSAYGLTVPLITTSDGKKFGKTEAGAVWLAPDRTSPYQFYQYFLNTDDRDLPRFFRYFTFLPIGEIDEIVARGSLSPEKREAQERLAFEVTTLVHGGDEADKARLATNALFSHGVEQSPTDALKAALAAGAPSTRIAPAAFLETEQRLTGLLSRTVCKSTSEARQAIAGGGVYLNEERVSDVNRVVSSSDLIDQKYLLLRRGKKSYHILEIAD